MQMRPDQSPTVKDVQPLDAPETRRTNFVQLMEQHGEFVTVPSTRARPPRSRPALQSNASSNAPSMPRALPEARASPTALAHQLLAIASATSTNERPKP